MCIRDSLNTDRKSPIGLERLVIWPMTADATDGITHGTASEISKILMTASDTPTIIPVSYTHLDVYKRQD